jgi:hypothetical protein
VTGRAPFPGVEPWRRAALCGLLALSCASSERATARHPAPSVAAPPELPLPSGLDAAVRVDIAALSGELGQATTRQFLLDAVNLGEGSSQIGQALDRAALLWFGLPAQSSSSAPSNVLVLRGHFTDLFGAERWSRRDSGVDVLELGGEGAPGYARVYRLPGSEQLVWSPGSELARVERALGGDAVEPALRPPERGAVSIAARPQGMLGRVASRYPELGERFRGVRRIEAFAEPTAGMWRADLNLDFDSATAAAEARELLERLRQALTRRGCALGVVARAVAVTSFERDVRVQTVLIGAELDAVKACVLGDGCCA